MNPELCGNDYEPCGECGYDHSYEQEEALKAHRDMVTHDDDDEEPETVKSVFTMW